MSATVPALPGGYQQHKSINEYYERLGANAPINSLVEEVADNQANAHEALKFGNNAHLNASLSDVSPGGANETAYRAAMPIRRAAQHKAINDMMNNETPNDPSDDFIAILGSVPERPDRGHAADHDPDGLQRDPAAGGQRLDPRQRLLRARPDRRRAT